MGVRTKSSDSSATPSCYYDFRTAGCVDTTYITARFAGAVSTAWTTPVPVHDVAPADAGGLRINCTAQGNSVFYDQLYVNVGSNTGY
jgi:hypothetical protein